MREQLDPIWSRIRKELRHEVPDFKFHVWVEPLELAAVEGPTLYIRAPDHIRTWVRDRYLSLLRGAAGRGFRPDAVVEIVEQCWEAPPPAALSPALSVDAPQLKPKFTFEQFVIGGGNRFAHAAALSVAELPGQAYNPLFIHGRPGLGKTHLLHAIGNYVGRFGSALTVRYATVEQFTNEFIQAIRSGRTESFKHSFRGADVLLLDDIQFLADKARTEEELFHTFNALHDAGRQLVLTSDRSPRELERLEERLGERFASGLVVALESPDLPVRRAILEKRARLDAVKADGALLDEIATSITTSVRALEAALIQVIAYSSLRGETPTPALAREVLRHYAPSPHGERCTVAAIIELTAAHLGVDPSALLARDRRPAVSHARKVAMYLARELTDHSLPAIGREFGDRDHSTVLSAIRGISRDLRRNPELAGAVNNLRQRLEPAR